MKRITTKLLIFLLLGAVVNVAVAWSCAHSYTSAEPQYTSDVLMLGVEVEYVIIGSVRPGAARYFTEWWPLEDWKRNQGMPVEPAPGWASGVIAEHWHGGGDGQHLVIYARGWPLLSLRCHIECERGLGTDGELFNGVRLSNSRKSEQDAPRALPLRPIFPGFLINTLFYAVGLWLLWSAPFATRRLIRKRRGRCVKCGYDLTGTEHDVCPECGR